MPDTLRGMRETAGLTLRGLAARVGLVDISHLSRIERGKGVPSPELVGRLADALEVDPDRVGVALAVLPPDLDRFLRARPDVAIPALREAAGRAW